MSKSNDNVVYLTQAAKNGGAATLAEDIDPLSDYEQQILNKYRQLSVQKRINLLRAMVDSL
jgi:hypothetical protein